MRNRKRINDDFTNKKKIEVAAATAPLPVDKISLCTVVDTIGQIVIDINENEQETKNRLDRHSMGEMLHNFKVDHRGNIGRKPFTYLFSDNGKI